MYEISLRLKSGEHFVLRIIQDSKGKEKVDGKILHNYIKNIYTTLLERGMYGTYIYVCNESLRDYFKRFFTFVPHRTKG